LNQALDSQILKKDSVLALHISEIWVAQNSLQEELQALKNELVEVKNPKLTKLGENIETSAEELKKSTTRAL